MDMFSISYVFYGQHIYYILLLIYRQGESYWFVHTCYLFKELQCVTVNNYHNYSIQDANKKKTQKSNNPEDTKQIMHKKRLN